MVLSQHRSEFGVGAPVCTDNLPCKFFDPCVLVAEYFLRGSCEDISSVLQRVEDWWNRVVLYYSWLKQKIMFRGLEGVFMECSTSTGTDTLWYSAYEI